MIIILKNLGHTCTSCNRNKHLHTFEIITRLILNKTPIYRFTFKPSNELLDSEELTFQLLQDLAYVLK